MSDNKGKSHQENARVIKEDRGGSRPFSDNARDIKDRPLNPTRDTAPPPDPKKNK